MVPTQYQPSMANYGGIMAEQAVVDTRHRRCHSLGARMVPGGIFSGFLSSVNRLAGQIAPPPPLSTRIFRLYTLFYDLPMPSSTHHC